MAIRTLEKLIGLIMVLYAVLFLACCGGSSSNGIGSRNNTDKTTIQMGGAIQGKALTLTGKVSTLAGLAYQFNYPYGVTSCGPNLYVADRDHHTIRKVAIATGVVTTLAGSEGVSGSTDGTGAAARFNSPTGITTDGTSLFVTDTGNCTIRKVGIATGEVTTLAGSIEVWGTTDGTGIAARFRSPRGLTTDGANLYVADTGNYTIRKVVIATGMVTTLAGSPGNSGSRDGAFAQFSEPTGITTDGASLYVTDTASSTIRKVVIATRSVTTLVGSDFRYGLSNGIGSAARFNHPTGITTDGTNLFVADTGNYAIRQVVIATGAATTLAGSAELTGTTNSSSGLATYLFGLMGITTDGTNLYATDTGNQTIRKVVIATGKVTTLVQGGSGTIDGIGNSAQFKGPMGVTTDGNNLYLADLSNNTIRKVVIATGEVITLAGSAGSSGATDGIGAMARFNLPYGVTTDGKSLYVTDGGNNTIRKVELSTGKITTLAGSIGLSGSSDGTGAKAQFNMPLGVTTDGNNLYVSDTGNNTIRKVFIATGAVTTLAGSAGMSGLTDGTGSAARFNGPFGITTDGSNLYVADSSNCTIRKVVIETGAVTSLAGSSVCGFTDGIGTTARFGAPSGITTDGTNLYVADTYSQTIRKLVIATGEVTTLAGSAGASGSANGSGPAARFNYPYGIAANGISLYVTDTRNDSIRAIQ